MIIAIEAAEDAQQGRLPASARPQNRDERGRAQVEAKIVQDNPALRALIVGLRYMLEFKQGPSGFHAVLLATSKHQTSTRDQLPN